MYFKNSKIKCSIFFIFLTLFCVFQSTYIHPEIFISEYAEGSSNNKALELYNPDASDIDLTLENYIIEIYFNGNTSSGLTIILSGIIKSNNVFVIAHSTIDPLLLPGSKIDQFYGSSWFNGNDAIVLKKGGTSGTIIDVIGQVGFDPGTEWGTGDASTQNNTLRRKNSFITGDADPFDVFEPSIEWDGFPENTFDGFGTYGEIPPPQPNTNIVINEIDADTAGSDDMEFIELYDGGIGNTDLTGLVLVLYNGSNDSVYYAIDLDDYSTDDNGYFLIGNENISGADIIFSNGKLQNGADAVALFIGDSTDFPNGSPLTTEGLIDAVVYGTNDEDDNGLLPLLNIDQPQINESAGPNGSDYDSNQRSPNGSGGQRNTQSFIQELPTPKAENIDNSQNQDLIPIYDIQGASFKSPYEGQTVISSGIVTAVVYKGFYLQDPEGDNNILTSEGIYVFTDSSTPVVNKGDFIEVKGKITEYISGGVSSGNLSTTEFYKPTIKLISTNNPMPEPVTIGKNGRAIPTEIIDNDALSIYDPEEDGLDFFESMEGMLVKIANPVAVSPKNNYNEVFVLCDSGENATGINKRGGITITSYDFNPERIQIQLDNDLLPGFDPEINVNDNLSDVIGVIGYSYGNFEILATEEFVVASNNLAREETGLSGKKNKLTIATFNVENLDPNDNDGDDDLASGKFDKIASIVINNLKSPDIIALQEIQDIDGSDNYGLVDASLTYQTLIEAISKLGGPTYNYFDIPPEDGKDGGEPGGNIRVGFLYNINRVTPIISSFERILDPDLSDGDAFEASRKPLAGKFQFKDQNIYLINNHFASKSGSTPLYGQVQPPVNGKLEQREAQALIVKNYADQILELNPDAQIVILGDLNEYYFETPLDILKGGDSKILYNLIETKQESERYSYNYEGNSQELDHILITKNLKNKSEFDIVHVNSEFSDQASDHDPLLLRITYPKGSLCLRYFKAFYFRWFKLGMIYWITYNEIGIEGFNIYCSDSPYGKFIKINDTMISAKGIKEYSFKYKYYTKVNKKNQFFKLEYIDKYGISTFTKPTKLKIFQ